jgi:uncharacterized HAD superfamily protein
MHDHLGLNLNKHAWMTVYLMKTIVWDIDDVLNDSTRIWLEHCWLPAHHDCTLKYENVTENPPHRLLGVTREEYLESLDEFRLSAQAGAMIPEKHLITWFRKKGSGFRHIALTARPRKTVSPALDWMLRYFGNWFQTFSFVPAGRPGEAPGHPDHNKAGFLSWLGKADYFIDDNHENVKAARQLGIAAFLVSRPWNNSGLTLRDILQNELMK